ncbi:MAG: tetratricopeptide repeat protein [Candidatus Margulisbacteria bacterium]|jgi:tetratricopeptide (TPR) repeat protein|nr:tetratricopeptide repeat protein [Candidatus Margulisiibacteriota bacterium]
MYRLKYLFCFFLTLNAVLFSAEVQDYIFNVVSTAPIAEQQEDTRFVENFKDGRILTEVRIKADNGDVYTAYYLFFDPGNTEAFYQAAWEEVERNKTDKAYFYETLALQAMEQGDFVTVEKFYTKALQKADDPELLGNKLGFFAGREFLWNNFGVFYMVDKKDPVKAAEYFNKAYQRAKGPYYRGAFYENLLLAYAARQEHQEMLSLYADYVKYIEEQVSLSAESKASSLQQAYSVLGALVYYDLNADELKQLTATLKPLAKKYSQNRAVVNDYAAVLMDRKEYTQAIPVFKQMSQDFPDYFYPPYNLGWIYCDKGDYAEAEKWYWKAKEIEPEHERLDEEIIDMYSKWITSLEILARQDGKSESWYKVLPLAQRQAILFPEFYNANYYLACLYSILNKKADALLALQQAYRLNPEQVKKWALTDEDLTNIKDEPEFKKLLE